MNGIHLPLELADVMVAHCVAERPNEACGVLAAQDGRITKVIRMTNEAASPVRYRMVPIEQKKMYDLLDHEGLEFGALYHSHTRTAAYPSPTDVREAREVVPYVIVSLADDPPVIKAYLILKDPWDAAEGAIEEVPIIIER